MPDQFVLDWLRRREFELGGGVKFDGKLTLEVVDTDAEGNKKPAK